MIENFDFGSYNLKNVPNSFQVIENDSIEVNNNNRDGLVGNQILDRFNLIIDYHGEDLYLQPNRKYKKGFRFNKSGLSVISSGKNLNQYLIQDVISNSPAYEVGLLPGDKILSINRIPYFLLSMNRISRILSRKEGRTISIKIKRGLEKETFKFQLKNLFKKKSTK